MGPNKPTDISLASLPRAPHGNIPAAGWNLNFSCRRMFLCSLFLTLHRECSRLAGLSPALGRFPGRRGRMFQALLGTYLAEPEGGRHIPAAAARGRFALGSRCLRWGDIPPGRSPLRVVRWAVLHGTMGAWVSLKETTFAKKGGRGAGVEGRGVLLSEVV